MNWIGAILGALGLFNSNKQANAARGEANDANQRALDLQQQNLDWNKERYAEFAKRYFPFLDKIGAFANGYDPMQSDQAAVDYAAKTTGAALKNALAGLNAQFRAGGGSPTGDTEFRFQEQGLTNRITDPLRAFIANQAATGPQRKVAMWQAAMGAPPGDISNAFDSASRMSAMMGQQYMNQANMFGQQGAGSLDMLGGALQQIFAGGFNGSGANGGAAGLDAITGGVQGGNPFYNLGNDIGNWRFR